MAVDREPVLRQRTVADIDRDIASQQAVLSYAANPFNLKGLDQIGADRMATKAREILGALEEEKARVLES
jgi:hypothetical protein